MKGFSISEQSAKAIVYIREQSATLRYSISGRVYDVTKVSESLLQISPTVDGDSYACNSIALDMNYMYANYQPHTFYGSLNMEQPLLLPHPFHGKNL